MRISVEIPNSRAYGENSLTEYVKLMNEFELINGRDANWDIKTAIEVLSIEYAEKRVKQMRGEK